MEIVELFYRTRAALLLFCSNLFQVWLSKILWFIFFCSVNVEHALEQKICVFV